MEEYRIDMKVRNNLILTKIEELGYSSPYSFCDATGISYGRLLKYLNMQESIFDTKGRIKPSVLKLCDELCCIPEEIFSASQMEANLKDNKRTLKVNEAEAVFMLQQSNNQKLLEEHYHDDLLPGKIEEVLKTLTPREQKVIEMRMGLGEYDREYTLEEIAENVKTFWATGDNVSRERIRQIEAKALRKLRSPIRSENLREHLQQGE